MCTVLLPPGVNPMAVNKYYHILYQNRYNRHSRFRQPVTVCKTSRQIDRRPETSSETDRRVPNIVLLTFKYFCHNLKNKKYYAFLHSFYTVFLQFLHSFYTISIHFLQSFYTVSTKCIQSFYTVSTKFLQSFYTVSKKFLHSFYSFYTVSARKKLTFVWFVRGIENVSGKLSGSIFTEKGYSSNLKMEALIFLVFKCFH